MHRLWKKYEYLKINHKKIRLIFYAFLRIMIETFNQDTLKTLNLYNNTTGYNNAAGILAVFERASEVFKDYYQYEEIKGTDRKKVEKIPEAAFRGAIANALIHRTWDVESQIKVSIFDDKIEIISPGDLPSGITKDEYLSGKLSVLKNRNLANVFSSLANPRQHRY